MVFKFNIQNTQLSRVVVRINFFIDVSLHNVAHYQKLSGVLKMYLVYLAFMFFGLFFVQLRLAREYVKNKKQFFSELRVCCKYYSSKVHVTYM